MKRFLFIVLSLPGLLPAQDVALDDQPAPRAVPIEDLLPKFDGAGKVFSHTEQFSVTGGDSAARGTAANLAEEAKKELLSLTEEEDEWEIPVGIELQGERGDPIPLRTTALDLWFSESGYELKVMVHLSRGLQPEPFKRAITSALIHARALEARGKSESDVPLSVPPWFVEGLREASAWKLKQTDRKLYDALFRHGGLFKIDDLFAVSDSELGSIDAVSKAAFRISSGALVMALLEQPDGKSGIRDFLSELSEYQGEMPALLRKHFPDLNLSATSLSKWWALQLADKGTAPLTESLDVAATENSLKEALTIRYRDAEGLSKTVPLAAWESVGNLEGRDRMEAVALAQDDLLRLSYRCFPSYRPLLLEYQMLLNDFAGGETKTLDTSLAALAETRATMVGKAERARDFLDWFEITRARETSGAFEDYLNLKARLKTRPNKKKDELSRYLERLDPLFTLPERQETFSTGIDSFPY